MNIDLCFATALELSRAIRAREMSAREVVQAHLDQLDRVNPAVNAVVTLVAERALAEADAADQRLAAGELVGPLHGLPVAHKDTHDTAGIQRHRQLTGQRSHGGNGNQGAVGSGGAQADRSTTRAALRPLAPHTPAPGKVAAPDRNSPPTGVW